MDFTLKTSVFRSAIEAAHSILPTRSSAQSGVLIIDALPDGTVWVGARTDEMTVRCRVSADRVRVPGRVVVSARRLERIAPVLTAETLQFTLNTARRGPAGGGPAGGGPAGGARVATGVTLRAGRATYVLQVLPAEEMPEEPLVTYEPEGEVAGQAFRYLVAHTAYATERDDGRPVLSAVLLSLGRTEMRLVATDGLWLATSWVPVGSRPDATAPKRASAAPPGAPLELIVPPRALTAVVKHFDPNAPIAVGHGDGRVVGFRQERLSLTVRLIDGSYPPYARALRPAPGEPATAEATRTELMAALKQMAAIAPEGNHRMRAHFDVASRFGVSAPDVGTAEVDVPLRYSGPAVTMDFDATYLLEAVERLGTEVVRLSITGPTHQVFVTPVGPVPEHGAQTLSLVMPLRPDAA